MSADLPEDEVLAAGTLSKWLDEANEGLEPQVKYQPERLDLMELEAGKAARKALLRLRDKIEDALAGD